jgi:hypothetical protein
MEIGDNKEYSRRQAEKPVQEGRRRYLPGIGRDKRDNEGRMGKGYLSKIFTLEISLIRYRSLYLTRYIRLEPLAAGLILLPG